ncbi:MAG: ParB/RepB/Spo0J family partition protein [Spirochaetales bacterium]|nr:ParB/RepB/Spo0J family partition protein [Spirochaetales bacterium]
MNIKIEEISIEEFDLSLSEMRVMNIPRVQQLEKSMRLHGQLQPVVARMHEGKYQIIDGLKRYYNAVDLMMDTLQCQLLEVDEQQAKILLLSYNRSNQTMEAWEEGLVLQDLMETHDVDQRQLAKLTGYSPSWVSRRLSLISKIDQEVSSEIRMGSLTSSHARALIRLPRGNQLKVARVITTFGLSSRLSNHLVDAFLEAEDEDQQRDILVHPEHILWDQTDLPDNPYDSRLCSHGNDLMITIMNFLQVIRALLLHLGDPRIEALTEPEKVIITPFLRQISAYVENLSELIGQLQIHKQDER